MKCNRDLFSLLVCVHVFALVGCSLPSSPAYEEAIAKQMQHEARDAFESLIANTNAAAIAWDKTVFVDARDFDHGVVFVPIGYDKPYPVSELAKRERWTDRFALAQEYQLRFSLLDMERVHHWEGKRVVEVQATVIATVRRRHVVIGQLTPPPAPPAGYEKWKGGPFRAGFWGSGCEEYPKFPVIDPPPGEPIEKLKHALAIDAGNALKSQPFQEEKVLLHCIARRFRTGGPWYLATRKPAEITQPMYLTDKGTTVGFGVVWAQKGSQIDLR